MRRGMADQIKDFDNPLPHRLALEYLFHGNASSMDSFRPMHTADYVSQFFQIRHKVALTRSPTLQKSRSIPAAIAGVMRNDPCRFTKL